MKPAWSEGQPWPAVNLVAAGTGEKLLPSRSWWQNLALMEVFDS